MKKKQKLELEIFEIAKIDFNINVKGGGDDDDDNTIFPKPKVKKPKKPTK